MQLNATILNRTEIRQKCIVRVTDQNKRHYRIHHAVLAHSDSRTHRQRSAIIASDIMHD